VDALWALNSVIGGLHKQHGIENLPIFAWETAQDHQAGRRFFRTLVRFMSCYGSKITPPKSYSRNWMVSVLKTTIG
jgi:hypothetical protein